LTRKVVALFPSIVVEFDKKFVSQVGLTVIRLLLLPNSTVFVIALVVLVVVVLTVPVSKVSSLLVADIVESENITSDNIRDWPIHNSHQLYL
uniref:ABC transmembrane type-1 domain-containing protein n=1 Tax=Schistosoma curassoni TaxID=6186 RepID=A0A183JT58_9TREM